MRDIGSEGYDSLERAHGLEVNSDDLHTLPGIQFRSIVLFLLCILQFGRRRFNPVYLKQQLSCLFLLVFPRRSSKLLPLDQDPGQDLAPASWGGAKIDNTGDTGEKIKLCE